MTGFAAAAQQQSNQQLSKNLKPACLSCPGFAQQAHPWGQVKPPADEWMACAQRAASSQAIASEPKCLIHGDRQRYPPLMWITLWVNHPERGKGLDFACSGLSCHFFVHLPVNMEYSF
jgi:hypothetical protein